MKNLSAKNNEEKNDFSASLRPFGTHNSRYLQGLRHILLRYRYGERQISANVIGQCRNHRTNGTFGFFPTYEQTLKNQKSHFFLTTRQTIKKISLTLTKIGQV